VQSPQAVHRPAQHRLAFALTLAGLASFALIPVDRAALGQTLPAGLNVVQGRAGVAVQGNQMTVTNSAGAVLNWQSFSIGAGGGVHFEQPSAASRVLNRVVGSDPSQIFGSLTSNGQVWLVNPYGVLFGRDARVDVGSLVVSTLAIGNDDWRAGNLRFAAASGDPGAPLVNQGELRTTTGGHVLLLGGSGGVRNDGLIAAPDGQVALAAGRSVELVDSGLPRIAVRVQAPQGEALNLGRIAVAGGRVDLAAAMVNQQGIVQADAVAGNGGQIELRASERVTLGSGSATSAVGASGGGGGQGGEVRVLGQEVALLDGSTLDVSGGAGGGSVWAGGGRQGRDASVPNARALYMGAGASVRADAGERGAGGSIVLWSDEASRIYGSLSARGGTLGGAGGFIETSGGALDARPASVRTDAPAGAPGQWLLDPNNVFISDHAVDSNVSASPNFTSLDDNATIATSSITRALDAGNNVVVTTARGGADSQSGDITVQGARLVVQPPVRVSLTLDAARSILVQNSTIGSNSAPLDLTLSAANGANGVGEIRIAQSAISTLGGNISVGGAAVARGPNALSPRAGAVGFDGGTGSGVSIVGSTLVAGDGSIAIAGQSIATLADAYGVQVAGGAARGGSMLSARTIDVFGWVDSNAAYGRAGVYVDAASTLAATHSMQLQGVASSSVFQPQIPFGPAGVAVEGAVLLAPQGDPNATLSITGTVADGAAAGPLPLQPLRGGVVVEGPAASLALTGGTVTITGADNSPNAYPAVRIAGALVDFSQTGGVSISGNGLVQMTGTISAPTAAPLAVQAGTTIDLTGLGLSGQPSLASFDAGSSLLASGSMTLNGANSALTLRAPALELAGGGPLTVTTTGPIQLFTDSLGTGGATQFGSSAPGTAVLAAGYNRASNIAQVIFGGAPIDLQAGAGRWLLYVQSDALPVLGLAYSFLQYGTIYPSVALGAGNGIVFAQNATLTLQSAQTPNKVYDGLLTAAALPANAYSVVGLRPGQQLGAALQAPTLAYALPDAGVGIPMTLAAFNPPPIQDGRGRPVLGYAVQSSITGNITPRPVTLNGVVAADKPYDGTRAATLSGGVLANLVAGQTLNIALAGGLFNTAEAGLGKPVTGTATLQDAGGHAANYQLVGGGALNLNANITPRLLTLNGVTASDKTYDGTRSATLAGGVLGNLVAGETLGLSYAGALFGTADAGVGKPVTGNVSLLDGLGRATNYQLPAGVVAATASILPATLTYVADPVTARQFQLPAAYSGSVAGFVGGDTLASATQGNPSFATNAPLAAAPGSYAIDGGGLAATNYTFVQAPGNAAALTVLPAIANAGAPGETAQVLQGVRADVLALPPDGAVAMALDATPTLRPDPGGGVSFAALDIDALPAADLSTLLDARETYMRRVLRAGIEQLDVDPTLANLPACATVHQAQDGLCLVTDQLVAAEQGVSAPATTVSTGPAAAPPAAPAAATPATRPPLMQSTPGQIVAPPASTPAATAPSQAAAQSAPSAAATAAAASPSLAAALVPQKVRPTAQPIQLPPALPQARPASAVTVPQIRRKFAVLFGNDNFTDASIPTLDNPGRDIDAVAQVLGRHLGYETIVIHDASRRAMVAALNRLALAARPDDSVIVYYAGHGTVLESNRRGYWIPADADAARPQTWLANNDIERLLSRIRASQVVLVADSCFSGTLVGTPRRVGAPETIDLADLLRRRTEVVMSSGGNEPVADGGRGGHSPFAASLMQSLQSLEAWRPGSSIYQRVREDVTRRIPQTPQYGPLRRGQDVEGADYVFEQRTLANAAR